MHTLIDPFELAASSLPLPPPRPPMATLSVDIDFELEAVAAAAVASVAAATGPASYGSIPDDLPESWSRIRCWCSED